MNDMKWNEIVDRKVKMLHNQIANLRVWIKENNGTDEIFNSMASVKSP